MGRIIALIGGWLLAYLGFARYAPHANERISNGYHPLTVALAGLELGLGIWAIMLWGSMYVRWCRRQSQQTRWRVLVGAGVLLLIAISASFYAYLVHRRQLPPMLGSYYRFYFATPSLWVAAVAAVGAVLTASVALSDRQK